MRIAQRAFGAGVVLIVLAFVWRYAGGNRSVPDSTPAIEPASASQASSTSSATQANGDTPAAPGSPTITNIEAYVLTRFKDVTLERDPDLGTPQFIGRRSGLLSPPTPGVKPPAIVAAFIQANSRSMTLIPSDLEAPNAVIARDYATRHNGVRHVRWQQQRDGLDIFGAHLTLNLTKDNEIINVSSRALHMPSVQFHTAEAIDETKALEIAREKLGGGEIRKTFKVRQVWYPLDMISCISAWEVALECEGNDEARDLVIRADTGAVVFDQSLTWGLEDISLHVYVGDSPVPTTPGPDAPTNFTPTNASRVLLALTALDTNASPAGWIPDGSNVLTGNNADVYADWDDNDQPDGPRLTGFPYRVFDRVVNLAQHPTNYIEFSQVQAFYWANFIHDRLYGLGFDEPAGNFQADNFGRGGLGGDPLKIEVQNGATRGFSFANKAFYTGFGDGTEGKVTVSIFSRASPLRDGALDGQLVLHEAAHGLTTRLIGDGYGLSTVQSRGMGEGWSDFFALSLLSEQGDPISGCYPFGNYAAVYDDEPSLYYYGVRRFPYSTNMNKAPQTFADTDPNQMHFPTNIPRNPRFGSAEADQVHNLGEIWCLALWECRANLIEQHGFSGNDIMEQLVVDGLKLTPDNPRFNQARDAILQADWVNYGGSNSIALWRGFAKRGLGYSAVVPESISTVGIQEAFDLPFAITSTVTETVGDGDGYVEPGETANMAVSLTSYELDLLNVSGTLTAQSSNVTVVVSNTVFADVAAGMTMTAATPFVFSVSSNFELTPNVWTVFDLR